MPMLLQQEEDVSAGKPLEDEHTCGRQQDYVYNSGL